MTLAPGVYYQPTDQSQTGVVELRTDIGAFVGIAQRGPLDQPVRVESWAQFQTAFGTYLPNAYLAYAVNAFFENGGVTCDIVRVAAPGVVTSSAPPPPVQPADGGSSYVVSATGFAAGGLVIVSQATSTTTIGAQPSDGRSSIVTSTDRFTAGASVELLQTIGITVLDTYRTITAVDTTAHRITWDRAIDPAYNLTLPITFDITQSASHLASAVDWATGLVSWALPLESIFAVNQPLTFVTGATAATGMVLDEHGAPSLALAASSPGTWGDTIDVRLSNQIPAATATRGIIAQPPGGMSSLVDSVSGFEVNALVRVYQTGVAEECRIVTAIDPFLVALTWDASLQPAFDITQPISFEVLEIAVTVTVAGRLLEQWPHLSMVPDHPRYLPASIANDSAYIVATDLRSALPSAYLHDPSAARPTLIDYVLDGGIDGIAALTPESFLGDPTDPVRKGLRTLELVDDISTIAMPDLMVQPEAPPVYLTPLPANPCLLCPTATVAPMAPPAPVEQPPSFSLDDVARIQQGMLDHCQMMRYRMAVLDPPIDPNTGAVVDTGAIISWRNRFQSRYGALYYPWVVVYDPLPGPNRFVRNIPPCGYILGVFAQVDTDTGCWRAPANVELSWAQGLTVAVGATTQAGLNQSGVNCLRPLPGRGLRVYGARTISIEPLWIFVNVRRLMSMIERAIEWSMQWAVFEPNSIALRQLLTLSLDLFLDGLYSRGAFAGSKPSDAYSVQCDDSTTPPALQLIGQLVALVSVAPVQPAEFVILRVGVTQDRLEATE